MNNLIHGEDAVIFQNRYFDIHTGQLLAPIETPNYTVVQVAESYYLSKFEVAQHRQICDLEITLPLTAGILCTTDGISTRLGKNEVSLTFLGQIHRLSCAKSGRFQTLAVNVKDGTCRPLLDAIAGKALPISGDISRQMAQIIAEFTGDPLPHFTLALDSLITTILVRLGRDGAMPAAPDLSPKELAPKLWDYLEANYPHIDSAESLAAKFGYSYSHICKVFSAAYHLSPGAQLQTLRLEHARRQLAQGMSVAEVADSLRYGSAFNFSRAYKKHFGVPPSVHKGK